MPRILWSAVLLMVTSAAAAAQSKAAGVLVDDRTRKALACVDVALIDSAGSVSERTQTDRAGAFQFVTMPRSGFALRASGQGLTPSTMALDGFESDSAGNRRYPLFLEPLVSSEPSEPLMPGDAPPGPIFAAPRLPSELRVPGMMGAVLVGFMLDARGRADPETAVPLQATHPLLLKSVVNALGEGRYRPARRNGRDACTFVIQSFTFYTTQRP